ncbi:MAG: DUF438 domain-containing protein [Sedimentisphaerales bacterium]|nr:DUF438 domain-containing protein [Sedimentisphaerales bacterium]
MMNKPIKNLAEELEGLLLKINEGKTATDLRKQATRLISAISPRDIAAAEDKLIRGGLPARRVQQLSAAFILMGLMDSNKTHLRDRLTEGHILKKVLAEHEMLRCFISDLEDVTLRISQMDFLNDTHHDIRRLAHIVEHVHGMQEHIDRENDVIFPLLRAQGWDILCRSVESEHAYIESEITNLVRLIDSFGQISFGVFKARLLSIVKKLCPILKEHLFHEDHVLYPVAVAMIDSPPFWDKMRTVCDEIDYCGIHL